MRPRGSTPAGSAEAAVPALNSRRRSVAEQRDRLAADLDQPRDRARAEPIAQFVGHQVARRHDRPFGLVARVHDRVELLEHPVGLVLGPEVVDVQEVDRGEAVEQVDQAAGRLERLAQQVQQARQRVDRHRAPGVECLLGDEHRERRLAGADVPDDPQAAARVEVALDRAHVGAHELDLVGRGAREVADRGPLEGHAAVAARNPALEAARARRRDPPGAALAVACRVRRLVDEEAAAVADPERAPAGAGTVVAAARARLAAEVLDRGRLLGEALERRPAHCA